MEFLIMQSLYRFANCSW
uniref:Uncharacterized protein n=1 Tax=Anguilla anguilla TaxID=7936 RepID=A0A0E9TCV0_ANGAN